MVIPLHVSVVTKVADLDRLKESWKTVYESDPSATVYQSWGWIRGWIDAIMRADAGTLSWSILAVENGRDTGYIGFLPIGMQRIHGADKKIFQTLLLGGAPWADNTGLICMPEYVDTVIPALAAFLEKEIGWDIFELRDVADMRVHAVANYLECRHHNVQKAEDTVCPYIPLPETWEQYLMDFLSSNVRYNLRRYTRQVMQLHDFQEKKVCAENLDGQIETLLRLWIARWGLKPHDIFMGFKTEFVLDVFRSVYRHCFEDGSLYLTILWNGGEPIAGEAAFIDTKMKKMYSYTKAYNLLYAKYCPGNVMTGHVIRYAIEHGFQIYDFGAGNEQYKALFGTVERHNWNIKVSRRNRVDDLKRRIPQPVKDLARKILKRT